MKGKNCQPHSEREAKEQPEPPQALCTVREVVFHARRWQGASSFPRVTAGEALLGLAPLHPPSVASSQGQLWTRQRPRFQPESGPPRLWSSGAHAERHHGSSRSQPCPPRPGKSPCPLAPSQRGGRGVNRRGLCSLSWALSHPPSRQHKHIPEASRSQE